MDHLEWSSHDQTYVVQIRMEVLQLILEEKQKNINKETGGILIGRYIDKHTAIVRHATPPPKDSQSGFDWFHRGVMGLKTLLARMWTQEDRQYYLGEWHYHPVTRVIPSQDDINQMTRISKSSCYNCPEPILLIVGLGNKPEVPSRMFVFPKAVMVEVTRTSNI
jgi:integrative and conjugative element protein (TIGR02256 family)